MELFLNTTEIDWSGITFLWNELWILDEVGNIIRAGRSRRKKKSPAYSYTGKTEEEYEEYEDVEEIYDELEDEEKVQKLIKMVCIVQGIKFTEVRELRDINITIDQIKQTISEVKTKIKVVIK